jgi:hypothetical protein
VGCGVGGGGSVIGVGLGDGVGVAVCANLTALPVDFLEGRHGFTLQRFYFQSKVFLTQQLIVGMPETLLPS